MTAKRSALIVATSQYKDRRLAPLEGPGHDAEALRTVLANKEIGGFDVRVALNSRVDTLRRTLESFFTDRARDDLLLVHFSGHGLKDDDGQLYLAAADTQIDRLLSTGVDAAWVNRLMNKCRSERIALFLDCCFAGAFTAGLARRVGVDSAGVKEQFTGSGLFVITASDAMQYSFEGGMQVGQPPEPSPFTRALVDGLRSGEADRDEDGHVSINELFDYLEDRIRQTSPSQTPTKSAFNQVGDWVIARSTRMPSVRLLPEDVQRHLKSDAPFDRLNALIELQYLIEGPNRRLAEAAMQALQRLTDDDSQKVAAAARRLLEKETARPKRANRPASRPAPIASPPRNDAVPAPSNQPEPAVVASPQTAATPPETRVAPTPQPMLPPSDVPLAHGPSEGAADVASGTTNIQKDATAPGTMSRSEALPGATKKAKAEVPWSLRRTVARAAIGSFLWMIIEYIAFLATNSWIYESSENLEGSATAFGELTSLILFYATLAVAIVEKAVPALRVPNGAAYRGVGWNRWLAAGILGALTGLTVGLTVEYLKFSYLGLEIPLYAALGFVAAEAIVGRWFRGHREEASLAA